jgi:hypothetical protein
MPMMMFAFTFNPDTKEVVSTGNITPDAALQIVQSIVISEAIKAAQSKTSDNGAKHEEVPATKL